MLKRLWEGWKKLAHRIGNFQARVILTVLYFTAILPFGVIARFASDPMRIKHPPTGWTPIPEDQNNMDWAHRQW
jgi:hypothetical protein